MFLQQQYPKLLIWGVFVGFTLAFGSSLVVEEDVNSCQMSRRIHGEMVNIKEAKRIASDTDGVITVPKGSKVDSYENCEQECCDNINCTVYMFYPRPPDHDNLDKFNCFLLSCRPQNVCALLNVSDKAPGAVVGLRDLMSPAIGKGVFGVIFCLRLFFFPVHFEDTKSVSPVFAAYIHYVNLMYCMVDWRIRISDVTIEHEIRNCILLLTKINAFLISISVKSSSDFIGFLVVCGYFCKTVSLASLSFAMSQARDSCGMKCWNHESQKVMMTINR